MNIPFTQTKASSIGGSIGLSVGGQASVTIPSIISAGGNAGTQIDVEHSIDKSSEFSTRGGLSQVVREIANSDFVLLLDDFHYMRRDLQSEVAKLLKEAVRLGVKVCVAAVSHRGDDVVRANPELRGRVRTIDLNYWKENELIRIAQIGFEKLNIQYPEEIIL